MTVDDARHLLHRSGFGARPAEIVATPREGAAAVRDLLAGVRTDARTPAPDWTGDLPRDRPATEAERREQRRERREQAFELQAWWYRELCDTPSPLTERIVLFLHGHFTSSLQKVRSPALLFRQNALFRQHAAGSFADLLHAVARDPAMMVYLDTRTSTAEHPNENFARELLELFTLGEGHYTEEDVREAARAFTGWRIRRRTGEFVLRPRLHDNGTKTFLGRTGRWGGDDIVNILLEQPRLAQHVSERAWRIFVSPDPEPVAVSAVAERFRTSGYALPALFEALFSADAFWDPAIRGTLVKSPVELLVGTARTFDIAPADSADLARLARRLGQAVFNPPTVAGWPGGNAWITSNTLLERQRILGQVARSPELSDRLAGGLGGWLGALATANPLARATQLLLPLTPVYPLEGAADERRALERILTDPVYQLT